MSCINWHYIFEGFTALGTVTVAILAIWGDWFKYMFNSPKLRIEMDSDELSGVFAPKEVAYYYHLKVVNKRRGSAPAKNCKVALKEIRIKQDDNQFFSIPIKGSLYFTWSPRDSNNPIFLKDYVIEDYFDFFRIDNTGLENSARPVLNGYSQGFKGFLRSGQTIQYVLEIRSENYLSKEQPTFEVYWNGQWNENIGIMKNNLKIKKIEAHT